MHEDEYFKNYNATKGQIEHALQVEKFSLSLYEELKILCPKNKRLDYPDIKKLIGLSAKLHDIGMVFERTKIDKPHNKIGAKLVLENKIDGLDEEQNKVVAASIRYHRGKKPKDGKHKLYSSLSKDGKQKVMTIASIIRIADSLDSSHTGVVERISLSYLNCTNTLTLSSAVNIMFNMGIKNAFEKKKKLFEEVFNMQICLINE